MTRQLLPIISMPQWMALLTMSMSLPTCLSLPKLRLPPTVQGRVAIMLAVFRHPQWKFQIYLPQFGKHSLRIIVVVNYSLLPLVGHRPMRVLKLQPPRFEA